uniref:Uncharacterized protein n=1 Tax=uncultured marine virus TaxID=186617 RepID=A0A0F7L461_9VIRU|nr:hypothetical protein [uncultured marine virus]
MTYNEELDEIAAQLRNVGERYQEDMEFMQQRALHAEKMLKAFEEKQTGNILYRMLCQQEAKTQALQKQLDEIKENGCFDGLHRIPSENGVYIDTIKNKYLTRFINDNKKAFMELRED